MITTNEAETTEALPYEDVVGPLRASWASEAPDELHALRSELEFRNMLRAARLDLGLTQMQASELTGEDQADISKMEGGRLNPSVGRVRRYLTALRAATQHGSAAALTTEPLMSAADAARYLLEIQSDRAAITALKLQKLIYYAQGYALALFGQRLFGEKIKAWENGPVVPGVWHLYKENGAGPLPRPDDFDVLSFDTHARVALERAYADLGEEPAARLVTMTHSEPPWAETNRDAEIPVTKMTEFFRQRLGVEASS